MTHGYRSAELAWINDDLGVARGGRRGMARLPAPSMDQRLGVWGVREAHALVEARQRRS
jgi:hypothetical protein